MTINERKELLAKPCWNYKDVMTYTGFKKSKAFEIMALCKEQFNGKVLFDKSKVKRDSVLAYMETSISVELYIVKELEDKQEGEHS